MEKIKKIIILLMAVLIFSITSSLVTAQLEYTPLTPIPGTTQGDCSVDDQGRIIKPDECKVPVTSYIPNIFTLLIGLAGVLAVLMIVIGGVQYLSTDAISGKSEAKERITNAILGLLLAIGAFVILNTINPDALKFDLTKITTQAPPDVQPATTTPGGLPGSTVCNFNEGGNFITNKPCYCANCVSIGINGDSTYLALPFVGPGGNQVNLNLADRLLILQQNYGKPWRITEAWKPAYFHQSTCHIVGTCVDAGLINPIGNSEIVSRQNNGTLSSLVTDINNFFSAAAKANLTADLEVKTQNEANILQNAGVTGTIKVISGITAPHWSIYLNPNRK